MQYSVLARYYDDLMTDFNYDAYKDFIIKHLNNTSKTGLDLATGSGEMAIRLACLGYKMTGADISTNMLTKATEKAKQARQNILFIMADLNCLTITKKYDFIISVCDGFNYVKSTSMLNKAFKNVYNALNDGGVFIFDISTQHKLKNIIGNNLFFEDFENLTYFWQNKAYNNRVEMSLVFFEKQKDKYLRFDELQTQYIYSNDTVVNLLNENGFKVQVFNENFKAVTNESERLVVVATK